MKELKIITSSILICFFGCCAYAQNATTALKVGDLVPDIMFDKIHNSNEKRIRLSDLKGKLVILDFFATWCGPCIRSLPKLDSLQKLFKDELVILPITYESQQILRETQSRIPLLAKSDLKFVYETSLKQQFPFRLLPHDVWIGRDGKVLAITDDTEITTENIAKYLKNSTVIFKQKIDIVYQDDTKPLLLGRFGDYKFDPSQIMYSSLITTGVPGVSSVRQYVAKRIGDNLMLRSNNCYVQDLYTSVLANPSWPGLIDKFKNYYDNPDFLLMQRSRLIWEASDRSLFIGSKEESISKQKHSNEEITFNYELILPASDTAYYKNYALEDLNRYFGAKYNLHGVRQKRTVKCYALRIIGDTLLFASKGGNLTSSLSKKRNGFKITNCPINKWLYVWVPFHLPPFFPYPIVNETNFKGNVDLDLGAEIDPSNFEDVNNGLKKFGLEFQLVERELDMIIIKNRISQ